MGLTTDNPQWIGAWWLGVFIVGAALILTAFPMMAFPRNLPDSRCQSPLHLPCPGRVAGVVTGVEHLPPIVNGPHTDSLIKPPESDKLLVNGNVPAALVKVPKTDVVVLAKRMRTRRRNNKKPILKGKRYGFLCILKNYCPIISLNQVYVHDYRVHELYINLYVPYAS